MRLASGIVVTLMALAAFPAAADQSDELTRLREEAARQRQSLEGTEARIRALEQNSGNVSPRAEPSQSHSETTSAAPVSSLVTLKKNWSQVERGTPQEQVQLLLGTPQKVLRIDGTLVWYYTYPGIGPGSVFFNASGKVSSWQSPSFGWW
jgi:hypothetical protein